MKPTVCRKCGCVGASCKYHKSVDTYPYYECLYFNSRSKGGRYDEDEDENEEGD